MKRDLELIRKMLLRIEEAPHSEYITVETFVADRENWSAEEFAKASHHVCPAFG